MVPSILQENSIETANSTPTFCLDYHSSGQRKSAWLSSEVAAECLPRRIYCDEVTVYSIGMELLSNALYPRKK